MRGEFGLCVGGVEPGLEVVEELGMQLRQIVQVLILIELFGINRKQILRILIASSDFFEKDNQLNRYDVLNVVQL